MIELNSKTQQDFLNREWVQKLLDAGVDMSDAEYLIGNLPFEDSPEDYVYLVTDIRDDMKNQVPTYTVSELLYKLPDYIKDHFDREFKFKLQIMENHYGKRGYRVGYYQDIECLYMSLDHLSVIESLAETLLWLMVTPKEKRLGF